MRRIEQQDEMDGQGPPDQIRPRKKLTRALTAVAFGGPVYRPLKSIFNKIFPLGYEDEKGFHYEAQKPGM